MDSPRHQQSPDTRELDKILGDPMDKPHSKINAPYQQEQLSSSIDSDQGSFGGTGNHSVPDKDAEDSNLVLDMLFERNNSDLHINSPEYINPDFDVEFLIYINPDCGNHSGQGNYSNFGK